MDLPDQPLTALSRRRFLAGALALTLGARVSTVRAHNSAGVVAPPEAPPAVELTLDDGKRASLASLLSGRVTALQLMFTSCSATCPIQGAVFAESARALTAEVKDAQWLSVSIDPARDTSAALRAWMARFGAHPRWRAARPAPSQLDGLYDFLKARNPGPDRHTAQVYFFNRKGLLAMRSVDFPSSKEITRVLQSLASQK